MSASEAGGPLAHSASESSLVLDNGVVTNSSPSASPSSQADVLSAVTQSHSSPRNDAGSLAPAPAEGGSATPPTEKRAPLSASAKKQYLFATATRNAKRSVSTGPKEGEINTSGGSLKDAKEAAGLTSNANPGATLAPPAPSSSTSAPSAAAPSNPPSTSLSATGSSGTLEPVNPKSPRKSISATSLSLVSHEEKTQQAVKKENKDQKQRQKQAEKEKLDRERAVAKAKAAAPKYQKQHKLAENIIRDLKQRLRDEKSLKRYLQNQHEDVRRQELGLTRKLEQIRDSTTDVALLFPTELSGYTSNFTGRGMSNEVLLEQVAFTRDQWKQESGNAREIFAEVTRTLHEKAHLESELRSARRNLALSGFRLVKKKEPKEPAKPQPEQDESEAPTPIPAGVSGVDSEEKQLNKMKQVTAARERGKAVEAERAKIAEDFLSAHARLRDRIEKAKREKETALDETALLQLELLLLQNRDADVEAENQKLEHLLRVLVTILPPEVNLSFSRESVLSARTASDSNASVDKRDRSYSLPTPTIRATAMAQVQAVIPQLATEDVMVVLVDPERTDEDYLKDLDSEDEQLEDADADVQYASTPPTGGLLGLPRTPRSKNPHSAVVVVNSDGTAVKVISPRLGVVNLPLSGSETASTRTDSPRTTAGKGSGKPKKPKIKHHRKSQQYTGLESELSASNSPRRHSGADETEPPPDRERERRGSLSSNIRTSSERERERKKDKKKSSSASSTPSNSANTVAISSLPSVKQEPSPSPSTPTSTTSTTLSSSSPSTPSPAAASSSSTPPSVTPSSSPSPSPSPSS